MKTTETELAIIGGGPGGYAAAFDAANRGFEVTLIEKDPSLGGVCLHRGCIPSKALLHATQQIEQGKQAEAFGIRFAPPEIELERMRSWRDSVVDELAAGLEAKAESLDLNRIQGRAVFESNDELRVETGEGQERVRFDHAIIAAGSRPQVPGAFDLGNPRIMTSREALQLDRIPAQLLVIGGGYIGLELGMVYGRLGASVTLVEATDSLLPGLDEDLVGPVAKAAENAFASVRCDTKVGALRTDGDQIAATLQRGDQETEAHFDQVLVAVGRRANADQLGLDATGIEVDERGFIETNGGLKTSVDEIYAIGDIVDGELLAHRAAQEARLAVRSLCGEPVPERPLTVPAVVFTEPEVAWVGLTEAGAAEAGREVQIAKFPWKHNGRAKSLGAGDGLTKLVLEPGTQRVLGVGMVGVQAGEMISEGALAVEMAATAEDLVETTHPHPTLAETIREAAATIYQ